ncbi:MAG: hypothetical protein WBA88_05530 [Pseudaminobacter sp.]
MTMVNSNRYVNRARALIAAFAVVAVASSAQAEIDGHGPDAWRVTGVSANDVLNARMGPGTSYRVIETFAHNERGMQQITCVPFYTAAHYTAMSDAQIRALPPRWCLMRNRSMSKAGWVAQRFITPDQTDAAPDRDARPAVKPASELRPAPSAATPDIDPIAQAQDLVREIYEREFLAEGGGAASAFDPSVAHNYFTEDIVAWLASGDIGAHPLYGAQDFDGTLGEPMPDPDQSMLRGMITINVDFTNFGQRQRAVFYLRADPTKPGAPLRIFRVEHDGWSYP